MHPAPVSTPEQAQRQLAEHGPRWWHEGEATAIAQACAAVPDGALVHWPDVARWRAMLACLSERDDALACLALAHQGHRAQGNAGAALHDAHLALVLCLCDMGAMDTVTDWLARARPEPGAEHAAPAPWLQMGLLARAVLGGDLPADAEAAAAAAAQWLHAQLGPLQATLSPDERLLAAQVLVNWHFTQHRYEQFEWLASVVEPPAVFERASAAGRCRWLYTVGFALYQVGKRGAAESAWRRALALAEAQPLEAMRRMTAMAMLRLCLDAGRLDAAADIEATLSPQGGAGRLTQLIELHTMRGRLQLLRGEAARALATVEESLALARQGGLSLPEQAALHTDWAQALMALGRGDVAESLLARLAAQHSGRDAQVLHCLLLLWRALHPPTRGEAERRHALAEALRLAQALRYTMFFRLLPALAGRVCALALRWHIEPVFVRELIRDRDLPAPPDADAQWPWALWLRMLGGFELCLGGVRQRRSGKQQHKPLELLRLLACETTLDLPAHTLADALWPEADGASARKSLEMTVQRLRRLLGDDSLVQVGDGRVALDRARVSSDVVQRRRLVEQLEALAMRPELASAAGKPFEAAAAVSPVTTVAAGLASDVLALSTGLLLPGAPETPWLELGRQRCRRDLGRVVRALAALQTRHGATPADAALLAAAADTLRERERDSSA
ncbi:MAG: hypothetical protein HY855_25885 [Burkholderiales bacterium]|nr:hypothetical protein [Burkholderiales bacterium]